MQTLVGGDSWNTSRWQRKGLVTSHWGQFRAFLMRLEAGCRSTARMSGAPEKSGHIPPKARTARAFALSGFLSYSEPPHFRRRPSVFLSRPMAR